MPYRKVATEVTQQLREIDSPTLDVVIDHLLDDHVAAVAQRDGRAEGGKTTAKRAAQDAAQVAKWRDPLFAKVLAENPQAGRRELVRLARQELPFGDPDLDDITHHAARVYLAQFAAKKPATKRRKKKRRAKA